MVKHRFHVRQHITETDTPNAGDLFTDYQSSTAWRDLYEEDFTFLDALSSTDKDKIKRLPDKAYDTTETFTVENGLKDYTIYEACANGILILEFRYIEPEVEVYDGGAPSEDFLPEKTVHVLEDEPSVLTPPDEDHSDSDSSTQDRARPDQQPRYTDNDSAQQFRVIGAQEIKGIVANKTDLAKLKETIVDELQELITLIVAVQKLCKDRMEKESPKFLCPWQKRWLQVNRKGLVYYKSDPQQGSEIPWWMVQNITADVTDTRVFVIKAGQPSKARNTDGLREYKWRVGLGKNSSSDSRDDIVTKLVRIRALVENQTRLTIEIEQEEHAIRKRIQRRLSENMN